MTTSVWKHTVALVLVSLLWSPQVRAESADPMQRGQELQRAFEYEEALQAFQSVVEDPSSSAALRLQALERVAAVQLSLEHADEARQAFERLLDLDPGHQLTAEAFPPPVEELFAEVRSAHSSDLVPSVDVAVEEIGSPATQLVLRATITEGGDGVARALAMLRQADGDFSEIALNQSEGAYTGEYAAPNAGESIEYYVELRAPSGHLLHREGSAAAPLEYAIAEAPVVPVEEPRRRFYRTWWFWTIIGVAVAGGAATAIALSVDDEEAPAGSLGLYPLQ